MFCGQLRLGIPDKPKLSPQAYAPKGCVPHAAFTWRYGFLLAGQSKKRKQNVFSQCVARYRFCPMTVMKYSPDNTTRRFGKHDHRIISGAFCRLFLVIRPAVA